MFFSKALLRTVGVPTDGLLCSWWKSRSPTCVDEAAGGAFAELFGFVGQRYFHHAGDVARRRLHSDGVRRYQLGGTRRDKGKLRIVKRS